MPFIIMGSKPHHAISIGGSSVVINTIQEIFLSAGYNKLYSKVWCLWPISPEVVLLLDIPKVLIFTYLLRSNYKCWVFLLPAISVLLLDINYIMGISWNEEH